MAPDKYVWLNCKRLIRQAITMTTPAIVKGTGKEFDFSYNVAVSASTLQWVPFDEYPVGHDRRHIPLRSKEPEAQLKQTLALVHE